MPILIASVAYILMTLGVFQRSNRVMHIRLVISAVILDVGLVLFLEFTRDAVFAAMTKRYTTLQQFHILCSTVALLLYFPTLFFGWKAWRRKQKGLPYNKIHLVLGRITYGFRTLGFVLMFSML